MAFSTSGPSSLAGSTAQLPPPYTARRPRTREVSSEQGECDASVMPWVLCGSVDNAVMTTDRVQHGAAVRVLVEQDLASEQMLALMREAAGLPDADAVGFYRALDFDIDPAPSDPRWPGRRRYRCVRRS